MIKYTVEDYNKFYEEHSLTELPCPQGDYSAIKEFKECSCFADGCVFGDGSVFGSDCGFGAGCRFGDECRFGEYCDFGNGCHFGVFCVFERCCGFEEQTSFLNHCVFKEACNFAKSAYFGSYCTFEKNCKFETDCHFGAGCDFSKECQYNNSKMDWVYVMSCDGLELDCGDGVQFFGLADGSIMVDNDKFKGNIEDYAAMLNTKIRKYEHLLAQIELVKKVAGGRAHD